MKNYYTVPVVIVLLLVGLNLHKLFAQGDTPSFNAPIITEVVGCSPMGIRVKFIDTNTNESGYYFYYATDPQGPFQIEDFDFSSTADSGQELVYSTNSGYEGNTLIYIKIAAFAFDNSTGEYSQPGPFSELDSATTEAGWPPSPTDFTAIAEPGLIRLTWTDNSEPGHPLDEAAWGIMRAEDCCNFTKGYTLPANTTTFIDTDLVAGITYTYRLESINHFGASFDMYDASATAIAVIDTSKVQLIGLTSEGGVFEGGTMFIIGSDGTGLTTLYNFQSSTGRFPIGTLVQGQDGLLYGVSQHGGTSGFGTIFRIESNGSNHTVLFNFTEETGRPAGSLLQTKEGILFGLTTIEAGFGTAYRINRDGTGYTELYRFPAEGGYPEPGSLIQASNGAIYGTTYSGGAYQYGQVFRMNSDGSEPLVLQHFSWEDVDSPNGALVQANDGALYGVGQVGGAQGGGTIYRVLPDASVVNIIHLFGFNEGGYYPGGSLIQAPDGALYGMTKSGGINRHGTLYKVNSDGSEFKALQDFDGDNGGGAAGNLVYYDNKLYGYTMMGGLNKDVYQRGYGVLFSYDLLTGIYTKLADLGGTLGQYPKLGGLLLLNPESAVAPTTASSGIGFTNIKTHSMTISFTPGNGIAHLVVMKTGSAPTFQPEDDKLYFGEIGNGTTVVYNGINSTIDLTGIAPGSTHFFTVFEYNTNFAENIRYHKEGSPVSSQTTLPYSQTATKMVGVTRFEGRNDAGTMYSMNPDGTDFTVLYNFPITAGHQIGTPFFAKDGFLYGVSKSGGSHAFGSLYKIKADGTDYAVIYNYTREDGFPAGAPLQTENGTLFGVSTHDDTGYGVVYKMNPDGSNHEELYRFTMGQGYRQPGHVMQASNGYIYATTYAGGVNGLGLILRLNQDGSNPVAVHNFTGGSDGYFAYSKLTEAADGLLYGVAHLGGDQGAGVLYRIEANGNGFSAVHGFNGNGALPSGAVTQTTDGLLYGVTIVGGESDFGTIYKVAPDGTGFEVIQNYDRENGDAPLGDLVLYDNKLYGYTAAGGTHIVVGEFGGGTIFYYEPGTATYHKLVDLDAKTGTEPAFGSLLPVPPREIVSGVQNFSVVNARTEEELTDFDNSVTLDVGDPLFSDWTIRANTSPNEVGSVVFRIDDQKKNVDNKVPYLLDKNQLRKLTPASHILEVKAYSNRNGEGTKLQSKTARIDFVNNTMVTGFEVLDMKGEKIQGLNEGDILNVQDPRLYKFNISAVLNRTASKGSVKFYLNNQPYRTGNVVPFTLVSGKREWWDGPGLYTVSAIPFSENNAKGIPGTRASISFYIIEEAQSQDLAVSRTDSLSDATENQKIQVNIYPVPARHELRISADGLVQNENAVIIISDMLGQVYFKDLVQLKAEPYLVDLQHIGLKKGMYLIRIEMQGNSDVFRFIKE